MFSTHAQVLSNDYVVPSIPMPFLLYRTTFLMCLSTRFSRLW